MSRQQPIVCREEGVISQGWMKGRITVDERQETNKRWLLSHDPQVAAVHQILSLAGVDFPGDEAGRGKERTLDPV